MSNPPKFNASIAYNDHYVQPLITSALHSRLASASYEVKLSSSISPKQPLLEFHDYENINFERALSSPATTLINAYIIRKAIIRKHYLAHTVSSWTTKHPDSILLKHVKASLDFELDYAEFLDDALLEAYELHQSFERNDGKEKEQREWWILKPGMSDRGQGIRLFSTEEELRNIFEEWEEDLSDDEIDEDRDGDDEGGGVDNVESSPASKQAPSSQEQVQGAEYSTEEKDYIITSQLRHFIAQPYIHPPLLLTPASSPSSNRAHKFHIRTYVLAVGALKVYVYRPMLALFAARPYTPPWEAGNIDDLKAHLTNTCIQGSEEREGSVVAFWSLPDQLHANGSTDHQHLQDSNSTKSSWKEIVWSQICATTAELFKAAALDQVTNFQPLPNAFELFGIDFLVAEDLTTYLLEVNAFPDFRQTGEELKGIVSELFEGVVDVAIKPFFGLEGKSQDAAEHENMALVCEIDMGRR
jgi:tubulin---tyrosine ligase